MAKVLRCGDLVPGCSCTALVEGKDVAEVLAKAQEHARVAHGMTAIPPGGRCEGPGSDQGHVAA